MTDDIRMNTPDMLTERPHLCEGCGEPMLADEEDQAHCPDCRDDIAAQVEDDEEDEDDEDEDNPELEARLDRALAEP